MSLLTIAMSLPVRAAGNSSAEVNLGEFLMSFTELGKGPLE